MASVYSITCGVKLTADGAQIPAASRGNTPNPAMTRGAGKKPRLIRVGTLWVVVFEDLAVPTMQAAKRRCLSCRPVQPQGWPGDCFLWWRNQRPRNGLLCAAVAVAHDSQNGR